MTQTFRRVYLKEDAMTEYKKVPEYVTDSNFVIHLTRSHFKQLAIGAANSGLNDFQRNWEAENNRLSGPCPILFNGGWSTRFDGNRRGGKCPDVFVALYADCASTRWEDYEEGSVAHAVRERLFALVVWYDRDVRNGHYLMFRKSASTARFDGLNLVHQAFQHFVAQRRKEVNCDGFDGVFGVPRKKIPGVARQVLHRTISELEGLFGQGKDFFKPKKLPKKR